MGFQALFKSKEKINEYDQTEKHVELNEVENHNPPLIVARSARD
jgi:hypothetical protein